MEEFIVHLQTNGGLTVLLKEKGGLIVLLVQEEYGDTDLPP